jgi:hypothetical protein
MAFADPQSVTVATVAKSLPRTGSSNNSGKFRMDTGEYEFAVTHNVGRRNRSQVVLVHSKVITDPFASDRSIPVSMSTGVYIDTPAAGYSAGDIAAQLIAVADWLKAGTNSAKLVGREI